MKIMQVIPCFSLAGAEIMCENLIYELTKKGHEAVAVSLYTKKTAITERLKKNGVRVYYLDKKEGFNFSLYRKIKRIIKQENPHVIHTHLHVMKYVIPTIRNKKTRKIHTIHTLAEKDSGKVGRILNKLFFRFFGVVPVALSEVVQDTIEKSYKIDKNRIPIIYNGISLEKCLPKILYRCESKIKILHIGTFYPPKNHKGLIEAFSIFHKQQPNSVLQLIGDGENRHEIERLVENLGLTESVKFLGPQSNVYGYLHEADIFTLPSLYEGIPMTLIEAMGTGLPIVATKVGGIPDMLVNEESALLTEVDSEKIAGAFLRLANDETLRKRLGENAKNESIKFSAEVMAKKYLKIYEGRTND